MKKLYSFAVNSANWKSWLLLTAVSQGILVLMSTVTFPYISSHAGGIVAFDMRPFGYSITEARSFLGAIDAEGLSVYRFIQLPMDVLYPALICLLFLTMFLILYRVSRGFDRKTAAERSPAFWFIGLCAVPAVGMLGDYAENICIYAMLAHGPGAPEALIRSADIFTHIKSISTTLGWSASIIMGIVASINAIRRSFRKE